VHHRVPAVHAQEIQTAGTGSGENHVDDPQALGRLGDARRDLGVLHWTRGFGLEHAAAAETQQRQDGNGENDDAKAADPVHESSPEVDRQGQLIKSGQDRRTGRREARNGLKVGVRPGQSVDVQIQGQRTESRQQHPDQGDQQEALAHPHLALLPAYRKRQQGAAEDGDQHRFVVRALRAVGRQPRDGERDQHQETEAGNQHAEDIQRRRETPKHARAPRVGGKRRRIRVFLDTGHPRS